MQSHPDDSRDRRHAEWVKSYVSLLEQMRLYVLEHYKMGVTWNPNVCIFPTSSGRLAHGYGKGILVAQYLASASAASVHSTASAGSSAGGINDVFADLNRGEAVTKGLRKVNKSEMTHKNPALRAGNVVPASSGPASGKQMS